MLHLQQFGFESKAFVSVHVHFRRQILDLSLLFDCFKLVLRVSELSGHLLLCFQMPVMIGDYWLRNDRLLLGSFDTDLGGQDVRGLVNLDSSLDR